MSVKDLIEKIKNKMQENGVSAYQLSKETGISQGSLSQYFSGKSEPRASHLLKILHIMKIKI